MKIKKQEIKKGIKLCTINTNRFKTNLVAVFLTLPITRENVTFNSVLSAVLRRGSQNMPTQEQISKEMENMYGASFGCGIDKTGDNHILKFYLESINDKFLPQKDENMLKQSIEKILEIVFNPLIENETFKKEYVEQEKNNIKRRIEAKIDNKAKYAIGRCIEEMYQNQPYGLYKYGYIEDLEKITAKDLYEYYLKVIKECKIDIFASGENIEDLKEVVKDNKYLQNLDQRKLQPIQKEEKEEIKEQRIIKESMDVTQGKLIIGLDVLAKIKNVSYITMIYNTILGVGANSKLFQNVREKASLAYTCGSNYIKRKQIILVRAGIEIENYEKAINIINEQLDDMKKGNFTEQDIENARNLIYATINNIEEEQDTEISYYFGQELAGNNITIEEYKDRIKNVTKEEIIEVAQNIKPNIIYFLYSRKYIIIR